jgi:hypothetical protein
MKQVNAITGIILAAGLIGLSVVQASAQNDQEALAIVRSVIKADRQSVVAESLQLTEAESKDFWPLYREYRAEMDQTGDRLVKLVKDYAAAYPNVPNDRARKMLKDLTNLEKKQVDTRARYFKKFGKVLPGDKNLRFAQVESRLDLALRLELASAIPLVPVEGSFGTGGSSGTSFTPGVPGKVSIQTFEIQATVAAIDKASRKITLVSPDGFKKIVKAGPEVVNFDQIRLGDQLRVTTTEQLVVQMAKPGESGMDSATTVVALAPKGAKPGGVMADATRVTATVTAIDAKKRTATLRFEDGTSQTYPVRSDIDLSQQKVGEKVVFRVTEMIAISVNKP